MNESTRLFRLVMVLAPLVVLALGSFWLLEVLRRAAGDYVPNRVRTEPDFYVEQFNYVKIAPDGKAQYHFSGARLTHNPQDDSYDIELPVVSSVGKSAQPMTVRSQTAHVNSDNSEVHMHRHVELDRPASGDTEHLHAKSEYLLVLPDDDVMKTDKPVEITLGRSVLTGVGMLANNATREFRLMSKVHGTYQPPVR
jgi:lipopolysaccharide export system protein LptC